LSAEFDTLQVPKLGVLKAGVNGVYKAVLGMRNRGCIIAPEGENDAGDSSRETVENLGDQMESPSN